VPYRNSPDIVVALLRNDMQMLVEFPPAVKGQVADGKLRLLATSGPKRFPSMPDVPTVGEAGVSGYEVTSWNGVFAPAATPAEILGVLNKTIHEVVAIPEVKQRYAELGIEAEASTPQQLKERLESDIRKWAAVIERANIPKQ
jgi:tripartite-type tricarboxylate transporter receptor subunit TctC